MPLSPFSELKSLSNNEISKKIIEIEKELFNLHFKKATRQQFKSHQIKVAKSKLAQLKTILTARVNNLEKKE